MTRWIVLALLLAAIAARADTFRFEAAGDPIEGASVFRVDVDLPVVSYEAWSLGADYAQHSFWTLENTAGNDRVETDFAPGVYLRRTAARWTGQVGYVHESNGRLNDASRSWNRIVARVDQRASWWRIEIAVWAAFRVEDTNPDLRRHVGDGEILVETAPHRWRARLVTGFTFDAADRGPFPHVRLQLTAPLPVRLFPGVDARGLVEARYGRGESLLRHEEITRALRFGLTIRG